MEWDTVGRGGDIELSSNCLTATKSSSAVASTVRGTILYADRGCHEFHVILDSLGPDGIWVGVASPGVDAAKCVGDVGCGWALHSDGDKRFNGREEEFTGARAPRHGCGVGAKAEAVGGAASRCRISSASAATMPSAVHACAALSAGPPSCQDGLRRQLARLPADT